MMTVEDCLPPELRGPTTTISRIAAGLSGAGVHRVEAAGRTYVLKVAGAGEDGDDWRRALQIQRLAAEAGLTPPIVHVDEARRAVLTAFVADRSFVAFYGDPRTHETAVDQLGRAVRRLHAIPIPAGARARDRRAFLAQLWGTVRPGLALPRFADEAVQRMLAEEPPPAEGPPVLSHNDLNPTNIIHDGEAVLLLDWAVAGPMDAFYDLAVIAVFLRMSDGTCLRLLAAHDDRPRAELPAGFRYGRRMVAALAGMAQLLIARQLRHPGATGETLDAAPTLAGFYQQMRTGALKLGTPEGQWAFGLALLKESLAL